MSRSRFSREVYICLATFFTGYVCMAIFFLYPLILTLQGWNPWEVGAAWIIFEFSLLAARPWTNSLVHRHGTRIGMATGMALGTVGVAFLVVPLPLWAILLGRSLQGAGWGMFYIANTVHLARNLHPEHRGRGFGISGLSPLIPQVGLVPLAEWLVLRGHLVSPIALGFAANALTLALVFALREKGEAGQDEKKIPLLKAFRDSGRNPVLLALLLSGSLFAFGVAPIMPFIANAAREWGTMGSAFLLSSGLSAIAVRLFWGDGVDRYGARLLLPVFTVYGAGVVLALWGGNALWLALGGILHGIGMGITFPLLYSMLTHLAPADSYTATFTLFGTAIDAIWTLGPLVVSGLAGFWSYGSILRGISVAFVLFIVTMKMTLWKHLTT